LVGSNHRSENDREMHRDNAGVGHKHHDPEVRSVSQIRSYVLIKRIAVSDEETDHRDQHPETFSVFNISRPLFITGAEPKNEDDIDEVEKSKVDGKEKRGAPLSLRVVGDGLAVAGHPLGREISQQENPEEMEEADDDALSPIDQHHGPEIPFSDQGEDNDEDIAEENSDSGIILRLRFVR